MTKINSARFVAGGLVAGVIMNAVSFLSAGLYISEMMGMFPMGMLAQWAAITLVGILASTVVGAWIYRE